MKLASIFAITALATVTSMASAQDTIGKDLLAYWDFNEVSGSTVADYLGLATGTAGSGVSRVAGPGGAFGNAGKFDGTANAVVNPVRGTGADNPNSSAFSFSFWLYMEQGFDKTVAGHDQRTYEAVVQGAAGVTPAQDNFIAYKDNINKQFRFKVTNAAGSMTRFAISGASVPTAGTWHHMTCTYDGTGATGTCAWYIDGSKVTAAAPITGDSYITGALRQPQTTTIGNKTGSTGEAMRGNIDDLAMWKRALNAGEVAFIYNNGKQLKDILNVKADVADWSQF